MAREDTTQLCVVLGSHWAAEMGGAQYQVKCLLELITLRPELKTWYVTRIAPAALRQDRYEIVQFGSPKGKGSAVQLRQLPALYRALRRLRPDVIYQRCLMPYTGVCALYCALHGARLVFHIASDGDARRSRIRGWGIRALSHRLAAWVGAYGLRHADAIVAQTQDQVSVLKREYGLDAALVVPNVQPLPAPAPRGERNRLRVVWVANFKPVKNPELFVELAETLRERSDVEFIMIGRAGEEARYTALHERIARAPNLHFLGELPLDEVNEQIAASDLMVNTSTTEGFPNTFIQAWMRCVPVLSLNVDPDGCLSREGAGIRTRDVAGTKTAIEALANDRTQLRSLGRRARDYALEHHAPARAMSLVELLITSGRAARGQSRRGP